MRQSKGRKARINRWYFNPRTPYGMRPGEELYWAIVLPISIHAPLTGCDRACYTKMHSLFPFQSTHPLRDATYHRFERVSKCLISIHAPLTGCDLTTWVRFWTQFNFNPRTPYGMRPNCHKLQTMQSIISIHAPLTGCDFFSCKAHN